MDYMLLFGASSVLAVSYMIFSVLRRAMSHRFPPGPSQLPLIGNSHNMNIKELHKAVWDHREKYGAVSYFRLAGNDIVSLNTIGAIRELYLSQKTSHLMLDRAKSFFSNYVFRGDIALQSSSEDWKAFKCVASLGLSSTIQCSKDVTEALNSEFQHLITAIKEKDGKAFDPRHLLSLSVINSHITSLVSRRFDYDHEVLELFLSFEKRTSTLFTFSARFFLDSMPFLRFLPFGYGSKYKGIVEVRNNLAKYLVHDVKNESEYDRENKSGIIYELLRAQKTNAAIGDENLEIIPFEAYSAGVLSVRATLYALIYHLLHHPEVQHEMYREILEVVGKEGNAKVDHESLMPYTQAVILESMRLTAVVPNSVPRVNSASISIYDYRIPKGTIFMPNIWKVHHDEEFWEEPWTFKPERFIDENGKLLPKDNPAVQAVIPFCIGQRSCMGERFSKTRIFLYLVNLLQTFEIQACDDEREVDPRQYVRDTVMYVPLRKLRFQERQ